MNSKLKAALITAGFGMWAAALAFGLKFASLYLTVEQVIMGFVIVGLGLCFYTLYSLILTKLEFDAKITELVDRK